MTQPMFEPGAEPLDEPTPYGLSPDTTAELERRGHTLRVGGGQGVAQVIVFNAKEDMLEGGTDRRASDGGVVGVPGRTAGKPTTAAARR